MKDLYNLIHLFILSKTRAQFYPTAPPYGSNWGHKIADFEFLPYISFIVAFLLQNVFRGIGKAYMESLNSWSVLPPDHPLMGQTGVIK